MILLPKNIQYVLDRITEAGAEAFCVGGCVRDFLLGKEPHDWDLTTSALPEEIIACFSDHTLNTAGLKHGTVTVIIDHQPVEITTYRTESAYSDKRHPDAVHFTRHIEEDLSRRDLTINAMAYHPERGLIDPYSGQHDLKEGRIRCVGDPMLRFSEDALRILRCLRFASQLGFHIDPATQTAAVSLAPSLQEIAVERIQSEWIKLMCGRCPDTVLRQNASILFTFLPELEPMLNCAQETKYHIYDVWEHTLHTLAEAPVKPEVRLALLFHDCGKPAKKTRDAQGIAHFKGHAQQSAKIAASALERLHCANKILHAVVTLVRMHDLTLPLRQIKLKRLLSSLGEVLFFDLMTVMECDSRAHAPAYINTRLTEIGRTRNSAKTLLDAGVCLSLKDLAISGDDLLTIGFPEGEAIGRLLQELLDAVLADQLPNDRDRLLRSAQKRLENRSN